MNVQNFRHILNKICDKIKSDTNIHSQNIINTVSKVFPYFCLYEISHLIWNRGT